MQLFMQVVRIYCAAAGSMLYLCLTTSAFSQHQVLFIVVIGGAVAAALLMGQQQQTLQDVLCLLITLSGHPQHLGTWQLCLICYSNLHPAQFAGKLV